MNDKKEFIESINSMAGYFYIPIWNQVRILDCRATVFSFKLGMSQIHTIDFLFEHHESA